MQTSATDIRARWLAHAADRVWTGLEGLPREQPQTGSDARSNAAGSLCMASDSARLPEGDFARLYDTWRDLAGQAFVEPGRSEGAEAHPTSETSASQETERLLDRIPPSGSLLAHLSLIEWDRDAATGLVYRFAGRETQSAAGRTLTGRSLTLLPSRNCWVEQVMRNVAIVRHTRRPLYSEGAFVTFLNGVAGVRASCELLLPLFDAAGAPRCTLAFQKVRLLDRAHSEPFLFADEFRPGRRVLIGRRPAKRSSLGEAAEIPSET